MKKKTIIVLVIVAVIVVGGASGIYANAQHQHQLKVAQEYKAKVTAEEKQVNDLQKSFKVTDSNAEGIVSELSKLKVTTKEAKALQTKTLESDKQEFVNLEKQNIKKLTLPVNDKRFSEISSLQANVKAIQVALTQVKSQTSIFTSAQIKDYTAQLNPLLNTENTQISKLIAAQQAAQKAAQKAAQQAQQNQAVNNASTHSSNTGSNGGSSYNSGSSYSGSTGSSNYSSESTGGSTSSTSGSSNSGSNMSTWTQVGNDASGGGKGNVTYHDNSNGNQYDQNGNLIGNTGGGIFDYSKNP